MGNTVILGNGDDTFIGGMFGNGTDTFHAGSNNTGSHITLGNGDDTVNAGASNTVTIGHGHDTIIYSVSVSTPNIVQEMVNGFLADRNQIQLPTSLGPDVIGHAAQVGADTVITIDSHDAITLRGVALSDLQANNFLFV